MIDKDILDTADEIGRIFAGAISGKVIDGIANFSSSTETQRAAIARIVSSHLNDWADEEEGGVIGWSSN